jgi:hypothetical protein
MSLFNFFKEFILKYRLNDPTSKIVFDHYFFDFKYYLQKNVRGGDKTTKISEPENLAKAESSDKVVGLLRDLTNITPNQESEFGKLLSSISGVEEALLPNSNLQIQ